MDPKIVYLATSGGGVFKSVDADLATAADWTWTPLTGNGLPASGSSGNLSVGALAMSPADPNVLYLGLGDAFDAEGRGLYRSTDGGATWTAAAGLCAGTTRVYDILALDANLVLAGTNGGLLRSTDGGATFTCTAPFRRRRGGVVPAPDRGHRRAGHGGVRERPGLHLDLPRTPSTPAAPGPLATVMAPGAIGRITVATTPASASVAWGSTRTPAPATSPRGSSSPRTAGPRGASSPPPAGPRASSTPSCPASAPMAGRASTTISWRWIPETRTGSSSGRTWPSTAPGRRRLL